MSTRTNSFFKKTFLGVMQLALVAFFSLASFPSPAGATSNPDVHGYAWSDTIGWVSFNCAEGGPSANSVCSTINYGVDISPAGVFTGSAWSDNVGWISFDSADVSTCGAAGQLNYTTGAVTGWARALAGGTGGWDGCISLAGTTPANPSATPAIPAGTYGLVYSTTTTSSIGSTTLPGHKLSGQVWDGTVIGWLDFTNVSLDPSSTTSGNIGITASPTPIIPGASTTVSWTTNGVTASSCSGTMGTGSTSTTSWAGGTKNSTNGTHTEVVTLSSVGTYAFVLHGCTDATTSAVIPDVSATVTVMNPTCAVSPNTGTSLSTNAFSATAAGSRSFGVVWTPAAPSGSTTITATPDPTTGTGLSVAVSGSPITTGTASINVTKNSSFSVPVGSIPITINASNGSISCAPGGFYVIPPGLCPSSDPACNIGGGPNSTTKRPPWKEQ